MQLPEDLPMRVVQTHRDLAELLLRTSVEHRERRGLQQPHLDLVVEVDLREVRDKRSDEVLEIVSTCCLLPGNSYTILSYSFFTSECSNK